MANYRYATPRRKINYQGISAILLIVAVIALSAISVRGFLITKNIKKAETSIEQIENDKIKLQEEIEDLEVITQGLEEEAETLKEILWRYEPVVIPDSMK